MKMKLTKIKKNGKRELYIEFIHADINSRFEIIPNPPDRDGRNYAEIQFESLPPGFLLPGEKLLIEVI